MLVWAGEPLRPLPPATVPVKVPSPCTTGTVTRSVTGMVNFCPGALTTTARELSPLVLGKANLRLAFAVPFAGTLTDDVPSATFLAVNESAS